MRGNGNDRSPVTLSSNLVLSPLFNVFPTGPHSKGLGSTSSYTALPEPGNAGGRAEMRGSGNDRGPVTLRVSGWTALEPGWYTMQKLNCDRNSDHQTCCWLRAFVEVKYCR